MRLRLGFAVCFMAFAPLAPPAFAADRSIIVLDASGSMWAQIDGKSRIEIARDTLRTVLPTLPADGEFGLMAYGHREKGSCDDIEMMVEPGPGTAGAIQAAVDGINPKGKTPLSESVKRAAQQLRYTEEKATVILITDGLETCNADPCALANELEAAGVDFTAHVVGFGLTESEGRQVACLAENTGGQYIQAQDGDALVDALTRVVEAELAPAPEPEPAPEPVIEFNFQPKATLAEGVPPLPDDTGNSWVVHKANADGTRGEYLSTDYGNGWKGNLEPGTYVVVAKHGEAEVEQTVTIEADKSYAPQFVLNAGILKIRPLAVPGGEPVDSAAVNIVHPQGDTTSYGAVTFIVPAGPQKLTVRIGEGQAVETVEVAAGQTVEKDVVVGVGRAVLNAFYVEGLKVEDGGLAVEIVKAAKKIDGSRDSISTTYGPDSAHDLPAGDYVMVARMQDARAEAPFSVKVGERTEASVVLNAGVAAISAPGASTIEVLEAKKDIQGKRKAISLNYGETHQTTLPAGDYVVVVNRNDVKSETPMAVKAGERAEINVE